MLEKLAGILILPASNFIFRKLLIAIITWIGYSTRTYQMMRIKSGIFVVSFFNFAIIILLSSATFTVIGF